ncbi:calcium-binding protein [Defluviimonas salinarum]|uniref:Ca2+-binding protein, RTX toxin-related n=1 Tax=Defluviimonas salinarum TaxID=2992147 RepID=A0ABT3J877_9RHOB|nr:hypothetical protein [Defluviimonas salinarum]MCW3783891.1 hypothetical protein [Defluviimonas salinarum]
MGTLYLAANYIDVMGSIGLHYGHLQIVYDPGNGGAPLEIEVQAPYSADTWQEFPTFSFAPIRNHTLSENTPNYLDSAKTESVILATGEQADTLWSELQEIHNLFMDANTDYLYGLGQNSNSYAASLLWMVGIDINSYLADVTPPAVSGPDPALLAIIDRYPDWTPDELTLWGAAAQYLVTGNPAFYQAFPGADRNILESGYGILGDIAMNIHLSLTGADDFLRTGDGEDSIDGGSGDDILISGDANDTLIGGGGNDILFGQSGNDTADYSGDRGAGAAGLTAIVGGFSGAAAEQLYGTDNIIGVVDGYGGVDLVIEVENLIATDYDDIVSFSAGFATSNGPSLALEGGDNTEKGDSLVFSDSDVAVEIDLSASFGTDTLGRINLSLTGFENIEGSDFDDLLTGDDGANVIRGGLGADVIDAGGGEDRIYFDEFDLAAYGGTGFDWGIYEGSGQVSINGDTMSLELLVGGTGNDTLAGASSIEVSSTPLTLTINWDREISEGYFWEDREHIAWSDASTRIIDYSGFVIVSGGDGDDTLFSRGLGLLDDDDFSDPPSHSTLRELDGARTLLLGGDGFDTYMISPGTGGFYASFINEIYDRDGCGRIMVGDIDLGQLFYNKGDLWGGSPVNQAFYVANSRLQSGYYDLRVPTNLATSAHIKCGYIGSDLLLQVEFSYPTFVPEAGVGLAYTGLVIRDFTPGDFGINLYGYYSTELLGAPGGLSIPTVTDLEIGGTDGDDDLAGDSANNTLMGRDGDDLIDGGEGRDIIISGQGSDRLTGGAGGDRFIFLTGDGDDMILDLDPTEDALEIDGVAIADLNQLPAGVIGQTSGLNYVLSYGNGDSITLVFTPALAAAYPALFGAVDDDLIGTAQDDILDPGAGNDTVTGGDGNDTIIYTSGNDLIRGGTLNHGSDTLDLTRYSANEVIFGVVNEGDVTIETPDGLITLERQAYYSIGNQNANIEQIVFADAALGEQDILNRVITDHVTGGDDVIYGTRRNDTIDGGTGNDTMIGGAGQDNYYVDSPGDVVIELANGGTADRVSSPFDWILGDNIERLILSGSAAVNGTGNALGNILDGNGAANLLSGLNGDDDLRGHGGNDTLDGGNGNDLLDGHLGHDVLIGGTGADVFRFRSIHWGTDTIADFNALDGGAHEGDVMRFEGLLTGTFAYLGDGAFTGGSDNSEARVDGDRVLVDTDGNGVSDITVLLTGLTSASQITADDFQFL